MTDSRQVPAGQPMSEVGTPTQLRRMSIPAAIACALAVATLATYLALLARQGTPLTNDRVMFVASSIALFAVMTGVAALTRQPQLRTVLLGVSTPGLLGVGFIGAWSVGLSLLIGGILTGVAAVSGGRASGWSIFRLIAGAILLTGITWGALTFGIILTDPGRT